MTDIVNPPCNKDAAPEPVDLETVLQASLDAQQGKPLCPWLLSAGHDEATCEVCSVCDACQEGEHAECGRPAKYRGHPRGDDFEIVRCCCPDDAEDPRIEQVEWERGF